MTTFESIFVPAPLRDAVSDQAWIDAMVEVEAALARAQSRAGVIPADAAELIVAACAGGAVDAPRLIDEGRATGTPVEPLVRALRSRVESDAQRYVHFGATSQDIVDSAAMLVARRALALIDGELAAVESLCAGLARSHRDTPMAARTLLQQAVPTTFGYKAAGWLVAVHAARERLAVLAGALPAQLGGAAGTLAPLGADGLDVLQLFSDELGLAEPTLPWHTNRQLVTQLGAALAAAASAAAKIGVDIALLAQTEVGEVAEAEPGGSTAMPQKRNPVGAVLAGACARRARGYASVLAESVVGEHERAIGAWHAEWGALSGALAFTGGAVASIRRSLDGLQVDTARMRANLDLTGGGIVSERLSYLPAGESTAGALDPLEYLGSAGVFVDRALEQTGL